MDLAPHIRELILLNECVILPEFGGFETQYSSAFYDDVHKRMLPPTKKILFRSDYKKGGGVLEEHLCRQININNEQATLLIKSFVSDIKFRLEKNHEAIIGGVGLFTTGYGNSINFTSFEEENYLAESFGLDAVSDEKPERKNDTIQKELKLRPRHNTLIFVVAGVIVISLLMVITALISSKFNLYLFNLGDNNSQNDLIIIGNNAASDTGYKKIDRKLSESTNLKTALYYSEDTVAKPKLVSKNYLLVAGSFKSFKNADDLQNELIVEGYVPEIIENGGYYRVSIGNFNDKSEALNELQRKRRQINRSVWLLSISAN